MFQLFHKGQHMALYQSISGIFSFKLTEGKQFLNEDQTEVGRWGGCQGTDVLERGRTSGHVMFQFFFDSVK